MDDVFLCEISNIGKNNPVFFLGKNEAVLFPRKRGRKTSLFSLTHTYFPDIMLEVTLAGEKLRYLYLRIDT